MNPHAALFDHEATTDEKGLVSESVWVLAEFKVRPCPDWQAERIRAPEKNAKDGRWVRGMRGTIQRKSSCSGNRPSRVGKVDKIKQGSNGIEHRAKRKGHDQQQDDRKIRMHPPSDGRDSGRDNDNVEFLGSFSDCPVYDWAISQKTTTVRNHSTASNPGSG